MNGASKTEQALLRINSAHADGASRYVDMQMAVYLPGRAAPELRVGGRWDSTLAKYDGPAATECTVELTEAQAGSWPMIQEWLTRYVRARLAVDADASLTLDDALVAEWGKRPPLFTLQLYGGRQGGKTHLAAVLVALVCVAIPRSTAAIVSSIAEKTKEVVEILERHCLPALWRTTVKHEIRLANGSTLGLYTGKVSDLKALGPTEVALLNESQSQPKRNWLDLQGNSIARAGLVVLAQNPPRRTIGEWTQELHDKITAGKMPNGGTNRVLPKLNRFASKLSIDHLRASMSSKEARRDLDGDMGVPTGDVVLEAWSNSKHVIGWIPTTWEDVTREITLALFGQSYDQLGGLDWDKGAGPSYVLGRIFRPRNAPPWAWTLVVEHGHRFEGMSEERFAPHLVTLQDKYGGTLAHQTGTIWVGDSSGRYQSTKRIFDPDDHPSWQRMADAGWEVTFVSPTEMRNPLRRTRFDLTNRWVLGTQADTNQPRMVMISDTAGEVIEACRKLPTYKLEGSRRSKYAHLVDACTYLAFRLFAQEYQAFVDAVPEIVARQKVQGFTG